MGAHGFGNGLWCHPVPQSMHATMRRGVDLWHVTASVALLFACLRFSTSAAREPPTEGVCIVANAHLVLKCVFCCAHAHLLQELREGGLMSNLDHLTEAAAGAAADIQSLQKAVLTDDNVRALRSAVLTLCKTLEHVESISADVSTFSRDTGVQQNLKTLITALSRIIEE